MSWETRYKAYLNGLERPVIVEERESEFRNASSNLGCVGTELYVLWYNVQNLLSHFENNCSYIRGCLRLLYSYNYSYVTGCIMLLHSYNYSYVRNCTMLLHSYNYSYVRSYIRLLYSYNFSYVTGGIRLMHRLNYSYVRGCIRFLATITDHFFCGHKIFSLPPNRNWLPTPVVFVLRISQKNLIIQYDSCMKYYWKKVDIPFVVSTLVHNSILKLLLWHT